MNRVIPAPGLSSSFSKLALATVTVQPGSAWVPSATVPPSVVRSTIQLPAPSMSNWKTAPMLEASDGLFVSLLGR